MTAPTQSNVSHNSCLLTFFTLLAFLFAGSSLFAQSGEGVINGNVLEASSGKAVPDATVNLICLSDPSRGQSTVTRPNGDFVFNNLAYGVYQLKISGVSYTTLTIDSIHVRPERYDFSLNDLRLSPRSSEMEAVVVYAEKPLIQSKAGNLTFNAAESALSASSSANELLRNVPLVTTDANGNILVRGKQPKVLIDDKPVDLSAQQLQDFLDALPGNMIEKIEVMTNPPPQYANEEGGVINIITRKGKIGIGGRLSIYGGTRGEAGANASASYRDKKLAINFNAGEGYNHYMGDGYTKRMNIFPDSADHFNTTNNYTNYNSRPYGRLSVDYDLDKRNSLNVTTQVNKNIFHNRSLTDYTGIDAAGAIDQLSNRSNLGIGSNVNPNASLTYKHKGRLPGEDLQVIGSYSYSNNQSTNHFYQQYLNPDGSFSGVDSTQQQVNSSRINGYNFRVDYNKPLIGQETFLYLGGFYNVSNNRVDVNTAFLNKSDSRYVTNEPLSSNLRYLQTITDFRGSIRQKIAHGLVLTAGTSAEQTDVKFNLYDFAKNTSNAYWNWLPFANINKTWDNKWSVTLVYRKTIRRPGLTEMNPSIDYSDPYNIKYGNPSLQASTSNNFEAWLGKNNDKYYFNYGIGYNQVQDVFSQIVTLEPNGTTQTTYQNISNRLEYSTSTWSGYNFSRAFHANVGISYNYNQYSEYDKITNNYHDGGSLYSNLNLSYTEKLWNVTSGFLLNRYANPQGNSSSYVGMNFGLQRKFFEKKFIVTLNVTDPFIQQHTTTYTYGEQFIQESYSTTQTRNFRLTLSYDLNHVIDAGRNKLLKASHHNS